MSSSSSPSHKGPPAKKARKASARAAAVTDSDDAYSPAPAPTAGTVAIHEPEAAKPVFARGRCSSLHAATMRFTGHSAAVYSCGFNHNGSVLATAGMDRGIFLWDVNIGDGSNNFNVMRGHKNAVLQLQWLPCAANQLVSCSADKTVSLWDANRGQRLCKFSEHTGIINSVACAGAPAPDIVLSGSDDCTAVLWDLRSPQPQASLFLDYQVTAVALSADARTAYTGGLDNVVRVWDLRQGEPERPLWELSGHTDTITGLALSPDGCTLLSNGMDNALRSWNVRPFVAAVQDSTAKEQGAARHERLYLGHSHGAEKALLRCSWSENGMQVACGSADRNVHIWDAQSCEPMYRLPGHTGSVNQVAFHPTEPVIASCSTDRTVWLGELS